jgi:Fe-S-cluster-containing hydrogenase component 2
MHRIFFSPTGTTRLIVEAVADGLGAESDPVDLTLPRRRDPASDNGPAIIGVPVYAGRVPVLAAERLRRHVRGQGRPSVLVVVYGNRAFEDALLELRDLAEELGFVPVAGAAFVGEHSFSTAACPVAAGRPDLEDRNAARAFGQAVREKLARMSDPTRLPRLQVPGNFPYRDGVQPALISPETVAENCVLCGECARHCPTEAISVSADTVETNKALCLRCCACIRICRYAARVMLHPRILEFGQILHDNFGRRAEPEVFFSS